MTRFHRPLIASIQAKLFQGVFGFVSGHDFSRAVKDEKRIGLQPLLPRILPEILCPEIVPGGKSQRLKARIFVGHLRPD
jgi:hypothetical protein